VFLGIISSRGPLGCSTAYVSIVQKGSLKEG
jgi:hypothetical protein